jgi:hypothetical protein
MQDRGSPFYKAKVLSIQGQLLPGDSGAPILDSQNRVLAIADGGLKGGFAGISWAVPMNSLKWEDDPVQTLARLRKLKPDAVFFFASENPLNPLTHGIQLLLNELPFGFLKYEGEFQRSQPAPGMIVVIKNIFKGHVACNRGELRRMLRTVLLLALSVTRNLYVLLQTETLGLSMRQLFPPRLKNSEIN